MKFKMNRTVVMVLMFSFMGSQSFAGSISETAKREDLTAEKRVQKIYALLRNVKDLGKLDKADQATLKELQKKDKGMGRYLFQKYLEQKHFAQLKAEILTNQPKKTNLEDLPTDLLTTPLFPLLKFNDLLSVSQTCHGMEALYSSRVDKYLARKRIVQLIGNLKKIEKGSVVIGPNPREPDLWNNNEVPKHAEITEDYWVPENVVDTQEQYLMAMGKVRFEEVMKAADVPLNWRDPNKYMPGLTDSQQIAFYEKRNELLRELWPIAYTSKEAKELNLPEHAPQAYLPKKKEYMYAGTEPLTDEIVKAESDKYSKDEVTGKYYTVLNGDQVEVTARPLTYSGTNDPDHAREYADIDRGYNEGPLPVGKVKNSNGDIVDAKPNARGLKGLVGGGWKAVDEPYDAASPTYVRLMLGGRWDFSSRQAHLASRDSRGAKYPFRYAARWPVYR